MYAKIEISETSPAELSLALLKKVDIFETDRVKNTLFRKNIPFSGCLNKSVHCRGCGDMVRRE